jgi:hypothetical protein
MKAINTTNANVTAIQNAAIETPPSSRSVLQSERRNIRGSPT